MAEKEHLSRLAITFSIDLAFSLLLESPLLGLELELGLELPEPLLPGRLPWLGGRRNRLVTLRLRADRAIFRNSNP